MAFHGPAMLTDLAENGGIHPFVERRMRKVLFEGEAPELEEAEAWTEEFLDWANPSLQERRRAFIASEGWVWLQGEGRAEGHLIGGNIEVFGFLKGTCWWPS